MVDALILMFALQFKHYYADFVVQTYAQTVRKGIYRDPVGISHSLDHITGSLTVLLIASFFITISLPMVLLVSIIEGLLHYHIDWIKVHYGTKDMFKAQFWNQFGMDQFAHQLTYLGMIYVLLF